MKGISAKKRNCIRPSPNEEAVIVQNEQERRKKIRLKQVREQERAFALKVRQSIKNKRENELKILSEQLKEQWTEKQKVELNNLEKKFQKNLEKLGDGHTAAMKDQDTIKKDHRILTKEDKQRASERHNQAIIELSLERARSQQAENDRAAARAKALEAEKTRATMIASLPPTKDIILNFDLNKDQKLQPKSVEDFKSTRYHLQQPVVQVERVSKEHQIDARIAAVEEEDRIHGIREGIQRSEAEQAEKARLRHKHALGQLKIEEDRKKLMDDLSELERLDRQRRQDAVAKIPVKIFQPPHKRVEDAEERQRDLEQAFEDMYMLQTGYTGDLTIALEPSTDPTTIPEEHQLLVPGERFEESPAAVMPTVPVSHDQEEQTDNSERESQRSEEVTESRDDTREQRVEEEGKRAETIPPKSEDAVKRLLLRIQRQREQGKTIKDGKTTGEKTPKQPPSKQPPSSRATGRATGSRVNVLTPLPEEEEPLKDEETPRTFPPKPHSTTSERKDITRDMPEYSPQIARTLLHPYEAAQQARTVGPQRTEDAVLPSTSDETMPVSSVSRESELLEQQRLQLQLQEQRMIQERLEEQLKQYNKQFQKISSEIPRAPYTSRGPYVQGTQGPYAQGTQAPYDQGTQGPYPLGTQAPYAQGPYAQGTQAPYAQGTQAPYAQGTQGPYLLGTQAPYAQGPYAQGTQGPYAQGTQAPYAQGTQAPYAQGTQGPYPPGTQGPHAQGTQAPYAQGTQGPYAQGTQGPCAQGTRAPHAQGTQAPYAQGTQSTDNNEPGYIHEEFDSFDQINIPRKRISKEDSQRGKLSVSGHVVSSESSGEGSSPSTESGTISLDEQTPDEEEISETSKSTSDYGTLPGGPTGTFPEDLTKTTSEDSIMVIPRDRPAFDVSSSDEGHVFSQRFLPLEWQRDSRIGSWKPSSYLPPKRQEYPLKTRSHETTEETFPVESSSDAGEPPESEDLSSSSGSIDTMSPALRTSGVPHDRLLGLPERKTAQSFRQSDSGFIRTLPISSLGSAIGSDIPTLNSKKSQKKIGDFMSPKTSDQKDEILTTSSSYSGEFQLKTSSSSITQRPGKTTLGIPNATASPAVGQTTHSLSRHLDGSPNYLDEYRRKWDEEKKLIENQRQIIRQKQEHQLRRMRYYQDILERYENNSPTSLDVRPPIKSQETDLFTSDASITNVATKTSDNRTSSTVDAIHGLVSDSLNSHSDFSQRTPTFDSPEAATMNKQNNTAPRVPPLGLKGSSSSSDNSIFTRISYPWDSSSSGRSSKKFLLTNKHSQATETRKSTSTSDFSFPSSGTEYHSLPLSPEVSANFSPANGSRSSITTLSELTEMMTKLTSSSENDSGKDLPQGLDKATGKGNWSEYLSKNRVPEFERKVFDSTALSTQPATRPAGFEIPMTGDINSSKQWYLPAKSSTQSMGSLGPIDEGGSPNSTNVEYPVRGTNRGPGSQWYLPPKSSNQSLGSLGPINEDGSPITSNLEYQARGRNAGPGIQQWYLPPKSSSQSLDSFAVHSDVSSPNTSNLQYPGRAADLSNGAPQTQQWFVPPKSSTQSTGSLGSFTEGSTPNTSDLQYPENLIKSLQKPGEKWYLPSKLSTVSMLSHNSERSESSPEHSLLSRQYILRDDQRQITTATSSSSHAPAVLKSIVGGSGVLGERWALPPQTDRITSPQSIRREGNDTRLDSVEEIFFSPADKQKDYSEDGQASPASLSSGSLVSDILNRMTSHSEDSTAQNSEESKKSDDDGSETTKSEPGNQSTEAETIKDSTGSENTHNISTPSEATEADKSSSSYTDIHSGAIDSNTTALQDAFARRKQDFVKKSLARVKRAKAKRFEVKPRVHIKKRVKPDKPVVAKKSKKSKELESKEKNTKRKLK